MHNLDMNLGASLLAISAVVVAYPELGKRVSIEANDMFLDLLHRN